MSRMSSSSPGIGEDFLSEAVRAIKSQRQRPSLERISRWLRFHKQVRRLESSIVEAALEAAVKKGTLRKDVKEGRVAYCEWKKMARERRTGGKLSIASAICQCLQQFGGSEGLALDRICDHVMKTLVFQDIDPLVLKYHVRMHCLKAVKRGKLLKEGRWYKLVRSGQIRWNSDEKKSSADLSFLVDRAVTNKRPVTPIDICSLCLDAEDKRREAEELIYCVECGRGGHPSCLKFSSSLTEKVKTLRWQCIECKRCSVCADSSRGHSMLFCDSCDRGFHMDCCRPPIRKRPRGIWICCICDYEVGRMNSLHCHSNSTHQSGGSKRKSHLNGDVRKSAANSLSLGKRRNSLTNSSSDFGSDDNSFEDDEFAAQVLPFPVSKDDEDCYQTAQLKVSQKLHQNHQLLAGEGTSLPENRRTGPLSIEFGKYEVMTWYSSPYPDGYTKLSKLHICEYCLRYMESRTILERHLSKCLLLRPPGDEIYRDGNLSVFEVDGNVAQTYCQNLCLLAKLFLDHKTLYYDVEPFLFYILTHNDSEGCHLVGYFSKEKYCLQKYNLSCIMVLPQYQRHGYGRLLIDFSYLLSRVEGRTGTPEKPLSDLGQLTYQSYWKEAITGYLGKHVNQTVTIKDIGDGTGICEQDVVATLQLLKLLVPVDQNRLAIVMDGGVASKPVGPLAENSRKGRIVLDPGLLQWKPFVSTSMVQLEESETFQELKELSRLVDEIRDDSRRAEILSPSIRLLRSGSVCSPLRKKDQESQIRLTSGLCNSKRRIGLRRSKSEAVGSSTADQVPMTCSTPLASDRLGCLQIRNETVDLSPVPDKQSDTCRNGEALGRGLKAGAEGDESECTLSSFPSSCLRNQTRPGQRKKRGWVKGRKRGPRMKDLLTDLETAERTEAVTEQGHDLQNEPSIIVIPSSIEQTECYKVGNISSEAHKSDVSDCEKLLTEDVEATGIYEIGGKDSVVEKLTADEFMVEEEKTGKKSICNCDEDLQMVVDSSVEIVRSAKTAADGNLSDTRSFSQMASDCGDAKKEVTFEQPSLLSVTAAGSSSDADLQEVLVTVNPSVELVCAIRTLNTLIEESKEEKHIDVSGIHWQKGTTKCQGVDDITRKIEETSKSICQVVSDMNQQYMTPIDTECQTISDISQNEVTADVASDACQQEIPINDEKRSFIAESTWGDFSDTDTEGKNDDIHSSDSTPYIKKDAELDRTELSQMTPNLISLCSAMHKSDISLCNADSSGGNSDSSGGNSDSSGGNSDSSGGNSDSRGGNSDSNGGNADDIRPIIVKRRKKLWDESNRCGSLLNDGKALKDSLKTSQNSPLKTSSGTLKASDEVENDDCCQNEELFTVHDDKLETLNGWFPKYSCTNEIKSKAKIGCVLMRNEELGKGHKKNLRKSVVEVDCVHYWSTEPKELAENSSSVVEVDCILNRNIGLKEDGENPMKSTVESECVLNGNKELKELPVNSESLVEVDCIPNGNKGLKEDGKNSMRVADPPDCLERRDLDCSTYTQCCHIAVDEPVTPSGVTPNVELNDTNGSLGSGCLRQWPDAVVAEKIKIFEISDCCINSLDDR